MSSYYEDVSLRDGVTVIKPKFKFIIGFGEKLRNSLEEALQSGARKIVIDMSGVGAIDWDGRGEMLSACIHCANWKAILVFAEALPVVREAFGVIAPLITYFETVEEAVATVKNNDLPNSQKISELPSESLDAKKRRTLHRTAGAAGEG